MSRRRRDERSDKRMNGECRRIADWIANPRPVPPRQSCNGELRGKSARLSCEAELRGRPARPRRWEDRNAFARLRSLPRPPNRRRRGKPCREPPVDSTAIPGTPDPSFGNRAAAGEREKSSRGIVAAGSIVGRSPGGRTTCGKDAETSGVCCLSVSLQWSSSARRPAPVLRRHHQPPPLERPRRAPGPRAVLPVWRSVDQPGRARFLTGRRRHFQQP